MGRSSWCPPLRFLVLVLFARGLAAADAPQEPILQMYGDKETIDLATGYRQPIRTAPAVGTVVTADEIEAIGAVTLADVLQTVPGLHVSSARGIRDIYTLRGIFSELNPHVLLMINGVPLMQAANGGKPETWSMPVQNIERVEVVRGPGSAVYGADAFAGVINVITKTARSIDGTEIGALGGSFATYGGWLLHGSTWGPIEVAAALQGRRTDGYDRTIEADDQTRFDTLFGTSASLAPGPINTDRDDLDARIDVAFGESWRLRAGYQGCQSVGTGVGTVLALDPGGRLDIQAVNADVTYQRALPGEMSLEAQISYLGVDTQSSLRLFPPGAFNGAFPQGVANELDFHEDQVRGGVTLLYGGLAYHQIRLGVGANYWMFAQPSEQKNFVVGEDGLPGPAGDLVDTDVLGEATFLSEGGRVNHYGLIQDEWAFLPDWTFTAGVRADGYSDFGVTVNPRASLVWAIDPDVTAKLLYGRGFRPPSFVELFTQNRAVAFGNPDLEPETIDTIELSTLKRWPRGLATDINLFGYRTDHRIAIVGEPSSQTASATFENVAGTLGYGTELEARYAVSSDLGVKLNYAYVRIEDRETKDPVGVAPTHRVYGQLDWEFLPSWHFNGRLLWAGGRQREQDDPRAEIEDYVLTGATLRGVDIAHHLDISLSINNLLDEDAREPSLEPDSIPGDVPLSGRSVIGQVRYRL